MSWKAAHKQICVPHKGLVEGTDGALQEPEKGSAAWLAIDLGKRFSRWLNAWMPVLMGYEIAAMDLGRYPRRYETHWCLSRARHIVRGIADRS